MSMIIGIAVTFVVVGGVKKMFDTTYDFLKKKLPNFNFTNFFN